MAVLESILAPESGLSSRLFFLARRFVAGETVEAAIEAVRRLNADGISASLDYLGEDVLQAAEAERTRDTYLRLLDAIAASGVRTNVSVKLTALGLLISEDVALENLASIAERASRCPDPFVRIDMEGSRLTSATLDVFERAFAAHPNLGVVLQAYLKRSAADVERMIALRARVRLCKGAYSEPAAIAYTDMPAIRREFMRLAEALLLAATYPAIATHDERLIEAVKAFAAEQGIARNAFEFQLLYGVRPELQKSLAREGYNVRVYVPFGTHWAGYFYRRIAERRENAFFVLRSMFAR